MKPKIQKCAIPAVQRSWHYVPSEHKIEVMNSEAMRLESIICNNSKLKKSDFDKKIILNKYFWIIPLNLLCYQRANPDAIEKILKLGIDTNKRDQNNKTPILNAIEGINYDISYRYQGLDLTIVRHLIAYGAEHNHDQSVNAVVNRWSPGQKNEYRTMVNVANAVKKVLNNKIRYLTEEESSILTNLSSRSKVFKMAKIMMERTINKMPYDNLVKISDKISEYPFVREVFPEDRLSDIKIKAHKREMESGGLLLRVLTNSGTVSAAAQTMGSFLSPKDQAALLTAAISEKTSKEQRKIRAAQKNPQDSESRQLARFTEMSAGDMSLDRVARELASTSAMTRLEGADVPVASAPITPISEKVKRDKGTLREK